ncbi:UNVERIFIED_CONTAM: hypothetical protein FKN15_018281 [Acipenser sinensis]
MTSALIVALPSVAKSHDKTSPTHVRMGVFTNSNPRLKKQAQFPRIINGLEIPRPHRLHLHEARLLLEKSESRTIAPVNQRLIQQFLSILAPTITFQVTSPHCRRPAGPYSDLAGHYGRPVGPHSAPFSVKRFSTSCELQQGPTAPFYSLPPRSSNCNLLGYRPLTAGIQQAPAVTSLAAMGVQHDPIVVSSL